MRIAVTVDDIVQVSQNSFRDVAYTKVFDSSCSIDTMLDWAKTICKNFDFHSLKFSEDLTTKGDPT